VGFKTAGWDCKEKLLFEDEDVF